MYILNQNDNKLLKADVTTFKALNLEERKHLQEWIAAEPASLGEELLIIQKEFDGFDGTKERLDLLAIDKQGRLVIIENKLDDSGRDVTWQAIKYASYCSSLTKSEIVTIFQKYLGPSRQAEDVISDFLEQPFEDVELNPDNSQRIFFVAANFRKEVTSSVLWLQNFGLHIKCFKVTPFKFNDRILIDFDQIIPIKDTEDYTIKMATKKQEAVQEADAAQVRRERRYAFWQNFIDYNKTCKGPFAGSSGSYDSWLGKSLGISGVACNVIINKSIVRTEIYISVGDKEENKRIFDIFYTEKAQIEKSLSKYPLIWQRLDDKISCRIRTDHETLGFQNKEDYPAIMEFLTESAKDFILVFGKYINKIKSLTTSVSNNE